MKAKIILVDDLEDIRELVAFLIECNLESEILQFSSGNQVIAHLNKDPHADLIISDLNMPDGNGLDILRHLKSHDLEIPIAFLSGEDLNTNNIGDGHFPVGHIPKPFTDEQLLDVVKSLLQKPHPVKVEPTYIPVSLELLTLIRKIDTPLYLKINDKKYVKLIHDHSVFDESLKTKYLEKDMKYLYIESSEAKSFIAEFKKEVSSKEAWKNAEFSANTHLVRLNSELLRELTSKLGWNQDLVQIAEGNVICALKIASTHPKLGQILNQFRKIERFGYADQTVMKALISTAIATHLGLGDEATLRRLTFASLFNDMSLTQDEFERQQKLVESMKSHLAAPTSDEKNIFTHPSRAAEFCRQWSLCPTLVDTIIYQHHELPDGSGFPQALNGNEILNLSAVFIVAEDFANYYFVCHGNPDISKFVESRKPQYKSPDFTNALNAISEMTLSEGLQSAS